MLDTLLVSTWQYLEYFSKYFYLQDVSLCLSEVMAKYSAGGAVGDVVVGPVYPYALPEITADPIILCCN